MERNSLFSGWLAAGSMFLAVAIVAGVLAARVLAAEPDTAAPDAPADGCIAEETVVDDMDGAGFVLAAYLYGDDAVAYLAARGGEMPDGLVPADFSSVQIWAWMPDGARLILFDRGGCARLMATSSLRRELALLEAFRRTGV